MRLLLRLIFRRRRPAARRPAIYLTIALVGALPPVPVDLVLTESQIRRAYAWRA